MMRGIGFALAATAFVISGPALADASYLCIGDLSTGFRYDGERWTTTTFNVDNDKFAVKVVGVKVEVTRIGSSYPIHQCDLYAEDAVQFACGGLGYGFVMNFQSLRFQDFYGIGYVDGKDDSPDTPATTIGKCSPL
jgi:hypothetical protein